MALNTLPNEGLTSRGYPSDRIVTPLIINGDMSVAQRGTSVNNTDGAPYLMDRFRNIDIGPATPTPPNRGGRRDERMMAQMPPVQPMPAVMPRDPNQIKKAVTPVGTAVTDQAMNEYLRLAGLA